MTANTDSARESYLSVRSDMIKAHHKMMYHMRKAQESSEAFEVGTNEAKESGRDPTWWANSAIASGYVVDNRWHTTQATMYATIVQACRSTLEMLEKDINTRKIRFCS